MSSKPPSALERTSPFALAPQKLAGWITPTFIMVGFDSAALLENVTLGKPCLTITTYSNPEGIHSMFNDDQLKKVAIPVSLNDPQKIVDTINNLKTDKILYSELMKETVKQGDRLYDIDYYANCKSFFSDILSKTQ